MGELAGASMGGFACPTIGDRQKVKVYGLRRWQQHQQGLIRRETIRLEAAAAAGAAAGPFFQQRKYILTQPSLQFNFPAQHTISRETLQVAATAAGNQLENNHISSWKKYIPTIHTTSRDMQQDMHPASRILMPLLVVFLCWSKTTNLNFQHTISKSFSKKIQHVLLK